MKVKKLHGFGNHFITDVYGCDREKINSQKTIENFLKELVDKIDMKIIQGPSVIKYDAEKDSESGITGFAILAESHISIHTYPKKNFFSLDIFSCKEFDTRDIIDYIKEVFKAEKIKQILLKREYEAS